MRRRRDRYLRRRAALVRKLSKAGLAFSISEEGVKKGVALMRKLSKAGPMQLYPGAEGGAALMRKLSEAGLMPDGPEAAKALEVLEALDGELGDADRGEAAKALEALALLDPYALRAWGLDKKLPLAHLGRALFHLNQRRGFKSNRKTDRGDNESGKIKPATKRLDEEIKKNKARTYGKFLHMRRSGEPEEPGEDGTRPDDRRTKSVRTRSSMARRGDAEKEEEGYDFYPDRRHLEEEFRELWDAQVKHHPDVLTDDLKKALFKTIFHQRPLKKPAVGLCLFSGQHGVPSDERRLPKAHPLTQRRVLHETVNNLRVTADGRAKRSLTLEQRDRIIHALDNRKATKSLKSMKLTLDQLGKVIELAPDERFTLETIARDAIACDPVRASLSHPDRFGPRWSDLDLDAQWEVIRRLREVQSEADHKCLVAWLVKTHGLTKEHASATANAPLPEGYGRLGETASRKILGALEADVVTYDQAVKSCGWHHSDHRTGEVLDELPYYGEILDRHVIPGSGQPGDDDITRFGRITNPTVHIGLNQLRRLVNRIIATYGKPDQIVVELARDLKQSDKQKKDTQNRIKTNTEAARKRSKTLEEELGQADSGANRMLLRLYEELGPAIGPRCCPYTGKPISVTMVFDGSCDVDHILPYSRTLDDSVANRTLCLREANREKGNRTPWEVWGETPRWDMIAANLEHLPKNKRWRFAPDAMERFEGENDFLDRALVDTQYLSRIARSYLDALYTEGGHVWVGLTEMLRRHWGLNSLLPDHNKGAAKAKNRTDHRHHAIDAAVIAATDRGLIKQISDAARRGEGDGLSAEEVARTTPEPWEGFRGDVRNQLNRIIVSHRADHGRIDPSAKKRGQDSTSGQLHNDTAYGIVDEQSVVSRKPLLSLTSDDIARTSMGKRIRDPYLQSLLSEVIKGREDKKDIEAALAAFAASDHLPNGEPNPYRGIRHVRLIESLQSSARVEIRDRKGEPYKAYKGDSNHCYEVWRMPDGKPKAKIVTTFEAHGDAVDRPHPAAKRLLRLFKRDMVAIERNGETLICHVQQFNLSDGVVLAAHFEANADARNRDRDDDFRFIRMGPSSILKARLRRVLVDEIGRVRDPGPTHPMD
ncbi:MAG: type II CRISPR RNA-guided endonuclease Cas9 [Rhodospirillales bacterium]|nr:type II CRISPR RNA-guided endonuclease Cas9 [Rhodospirillales bacterium]